MTTSRSFIQGAMVRRTIILFGAVALLASFGAGTAMAGKKTGGLVKAPTCDGLAVTIGGTMDADTITGTGGDDVILSRSGDDVVNGLGGNDTICAGPGDDVISGDDGDDMIIGGGGADQITGALGTDAVSYLTAPAGVVADLSLGNANDGRGSTDTLTTVENLYGSAFDDTLVGDAQVNFLDGSGGVNTCVYDVSDTAMNCA